MMRHFSLLLNLLLSSTLFWGVPEVGGELSAKDRVTFYPAGAAEMAAQPTVMRHDVAGANSGEGSGD